MLKHSLFPCLIVQQLCPVSLALHIFKISQKIYPSDTERLLALSGNIFESLYKSLVINQPGNELSVFQYGMIMFVQLYKTCKVKVVYSTSGVSVALSDVDTERERGS